MALVFPVTKPPPLISAVTLPWTSESPGFQAHQRRQGEALLAVAQCCSNPDISAPAAQAQFLQIRQFLELEKHIEEPSIKQIAKVPSLHTIIVCTVATFSMLTGVNLFPYYLGTAVINAGITNSTTQLEINIILNSSVRWSSSLAPPPSNRVGLLNRFHYWFHGISLLSSVL